MKHVLIHTIPRSGSKALQSSIQAHLISKNKSTATLENRKIDYGLDEIFVNRQCSTTYKIYNEAEDTWLLKASFGESIPDGALWERLFLTEAGNLKWDFIPAKKPFAKNSLQFLKQQYDLLRQLGNRPYVAKMFTGYALYNVKNTKAINKVLSCFDTHVILRRRDNLANFLSRATCGRIGNWSAVDQEIDAITADQRSITFTEFDAWYTGILSFEKQILSIPNPTLYGLRIFQKVM
jgi:hypothetical protein